MTFQSILLIWTSWHLQVLMDLEVEQTEADALEVLHKCTFDHGLSSKNWEQLDRRRGGIATIKTGPHEVKQHGSAFWNHQQRLNGFSPLWALNGGALKAIPFSVPKHLTYLTHQTRSVYPIRYRCYMLEPKSVDQSPLRGMGVSTLSKLREIFPKSTNNQYCINTAYHARCTTFGVRSLPLRNSASAPNRRCFSHTFCRVVVAQWCSPHEVPYPLWTFLFLWLFDLFMYMLCKTVIVDLLPRLFKAWCLCLNKLLGNNFILGCPAYDKFACQSRGLDVVCSCLTTSVMFMHCSAIHTCSCHCHPLQLKSTTLKMFYDNYESATKNNHMPVSSRQVLIS